MMSGRHAQGRSVVRLLIFHSDDKLYAAFKAMLLKLCDAQARSSRSLITQWSGFLQSLDWIDIQTVQSTASLCK